MFSENGSVYLPADNNELELASLRSDANPDVHSEQLLLLKMEAKEDMRAASIKPHKPAWREDRCQTGMNGRRRTGRRVEAQTVS